MQKARSNCEMPSIKPIATLQDCACEHKLVPTKVVVAESSTALSCQSCDAGLAMRDTK